MFGCNNDHRFPEKYMVKDHTSFFRGTFLLFQGPKALGYLDETTELEGNKNAKVCSNHFKLGKPVDSHPHPTFFLNGYNREIVTRKRKAPVDRLPVPSIRIKKKKSCTDSKQREKKETMNIVHTTKKPTGYGFSLYYLSGKRRSLLHPILTRHNDLFSYYNLILVKR